MRFVLLALPMLLIGLGVAGCASSEKAPSQGMGNLVVTVLAEPKAGAKEFERAPVSTYDRPAPPPAKALAGYELVAYDQLDSVVVWIEPVDRRARTPRIVASRVELGLGGEAVPVLAAQVGSPVAFVNDADQALSAYAVSEHEQFGIGEIAGGQSVLVTPERAGLFDIVDTRGTTHARLLVVAAVDHAMTTAGETVTFQDLEPGVYRVIAWHPRLPGGEQRVTLGADQTQRVRLVIGVNALPKVGDGGRP